MNLQESIRRILREDKDHTNLLKGIIDSSDIFDYKHFCGFDIITPEERSDQYNFLNKNKIPYLIKVYFVGGPNSEVWPRTQAIRNKELDLMEDLHEYIKSFVPFNIEMMGAHVNSCDGYKKLMKRKYSTDDLQESIKRILREENKKSGLLRAIEEDGLYQVIQDTGLSMGQIILKYDNLPREVFERYIKDFINEEGYHQTDGSVQLVYVVKIQTHVYIDHFYMKGDKVTLEISRIDNRGHQTEGYIESMLNLTDEEIFNIVDDMTRNMEDNRD